MPEVEELISAEELAARFKIRLDRVYQLTRDATLPVVRLGRQYRYAPSAVAAFIAGGGQQTSRAAKDAA